MTTWRAALSLLILHAQLQAGSRAAPPATAAAEWGLVADDAHSITSDHYPHDFPGWGDDIVTAADFPNRPDLGLDAHQVLDDIRRSRDPRVKYGISNGQMFSSYATSTYPAWTWRPYTGTDGHFTHGHLSVVGDARADDQSPWQTIGRPTGDTMYVQTPDGAVYAIGPAGPVHITWSEWSKFPKPTPPLLVLDNAERLALYRPTPAVVNTAELAAALLADPAFAQALADAAFSGSQRAERE